MLTASVIGIVALVGLVAGVLGGLLGVGGSVIMIPALVLLFGQDQHPGFNQHLYQAAAMIVNVFVALPAARRHDRAGTMVPRALRVMLPAALVFIFVGVWLSNRVDAVLLQRILAAFLVYVIVVNIRRLVRPRLEAETVADASNAAVLSVPRGGTVGALMGFVAGLLGFGGGAVAVPLQQVLLKLPLRSCIAHSAAVISVTAGFGALYKNATLGQHGLAWQNSLLLAALLIPTAFLGGHLGAHLTHALPLRAVRVVFIGLMLVAAWRMAGL